MMGLLTLLKTITDTFSLSIHLSADRQACCECLSNWMGLKNKAVPTPRNDPSQPKLKCLKFYANRQPCFQFNA